MNSSFLESFGQLCQTSFESLLLISLIGGLVVLCAAAFHRLLKRWLAPGFLYLLWILVIIRFALFAVPESPTSLLNLFVQSTVVSDSLREVPPSRLIFASSPSVTLPSTEIQSVTDFHRIETDKSAAPMTHLILLLSLIWAIGMSWMGVRLLIGWLKIQRLLAATSEPSSELQSRFNCLRSRLCNNSRVSLRVTEELDTPAMFGFFRPKIFLPCWCLGDLTSQQLDLILAHELIHVRRYDGLIQLLAHLITIMHWFNPLVRVASRAMESCRELSCDQHVLEKMCRGNGSRTMRIYGKTILDIAERSIKSRLISPALLGGFLGNNEHLIKQRIEMLVGQKSKKKLGMILGVICAAILICCGFTTAQSDQQEVQSPKPGQIYSNPVITIPANADSLSPDNSVNGVQDNSFKLTTGLEILSGANICFIESIDAEQDFALFKVVDSSICKLEVESKNVIRLVALASGETSIRFADEQGEEIEYTVSVLPKPVTIVRGTTKRLKFTKKIPEIMIDSPEVINATPIAAAEIAVTGIEYGISKMIVTMHDRSCQDFQVQVVPDTRGLEEAIKESFPGADIQLQAFASNIVMKGTAPKEHLTRIEELANTVSDVPVVNQVTDNQLIAIKVEVYELDKKKLTDLGIEFNGRKVATTMDLLSADRKSTKDGDIAFEVLDGTDSAFSRLLTELEERSIAQLMDQPTLVARDQKAAEFLSGGEVPITTQDENGKKKIEFRPFGTILHITPAIQDEESLTLEIRAEFSKLDEELGVDGVPGFRVRRLNTGLEMELGKTVAIVGDSPDSRVEDNAEKERVLLITPRLVRKIDGLLDR